MSAACSNTPAPASEKLVIGIGNEFRGDDGVGLFVAGRFRESADVGVRVLESSGEGTELMSLWSGAGLVVVVDAVHSRGEPGQIFRFILPGDKIPGAIFPRHSTHAFGLVEALELSAMMGSMPRRMIVYGIEGRSFQTGAAISDEVMKAASEVLARLAGDFAETSLW